LGGVGLLVDKRDDVAPRAVEPGRVILNLHVADAQAAARHLDEISNATHWSRFTEPSLERPSTPVQSLIFVRLSNDAMSTTVSFDVDHDPVLTGLALTTASGRTHGDR
jgi:hypothetical protein